MTNTREVNSYIHPVGQPVEVREFVSREVYLRGRVQGTRVVIDEPGDEPYRVFRLALDGGGETWVCGEDTFVDHVAVKKVLDTLA